MDEKKSTSADLVHLARLSLAGRSQDVLDYVLRLSRRVRKTEPDLAAELAKIISENPTRQTPTRGSTLAAIPVDTDSRLQLVRFDPVPAVDHEPIWSDEVGRQLGQLVAEHLRGDELLAAGLSPTRTAVFTGPPGVGKTFAARVIARNIGRPLITLDLSAVISSFLGRTGSNVRNVLDYAKGVSCVLLLDEIDALAKRRDDAHEVGELKRLVTVLLQEVDDWPAGGLLVAATNHADLLDPAIWRRFEMRIEFPMPDGASVAEAVRMFLNAGEAVGEEWVGIMSASLARWSFSDIERELTGARRQALVNRQPLEFALAQVVSRQVARLSKREAKGLARRLDRAGISHHEIHRLTGLSRDTIRRACRATSSTRSDGD